jgi:DNA polymerase-4
MTITDDPRTSVTTTTIELPQERTVPTGGRQRPSGRAALGWLAVAIAIGALALLVVRFVADDAGVPAVPARRLLSVSGASAGRSAGRRRSSAGRRSVRLPNTCSTRLADVVRPLDDATILHADLDAFYASVEQLLDPSLRGRPIAVGGGVVLAASYEAKRFGVQGGMSGRRARELCPGLQFVGGHFREYQRLADQVMGILGDVTPDVQRISIDEAFLDVAGTVRLFGAPEAIAAGLRRRVRDEVGLPISVGVARTKHLAKIASQVAKPDGLVVVAPDREREFLDPLPVGLMWGVGPVTRQRLESLGIHTIGELAASDARAMGAVLGRSIGPKLVALAANEDPRRVRRNGRAGSVGAQSAFAAALATPDLVRPVLAHLADRVASRLRSAGRAGRTVTVRIRFADLRAITRSSTSADPVSTTLTLTEVAERLVLDAVDAMDVTPLLTLLGISVSQLVDQPMFQTRLVLGLDGDLPDADGRRWSIDRSVDAIRAKFGRRAVGYASAHGERRRVPDDFRELAEHEL